MTELRKKRYYDAHKDEVNARTNKWRHDNPDRVREIRKRNKQTFREKMDAEYPGGYRAYQAEAQRKYRAKKKAEVSLEEAGRSAKE